MRVAIAGVPVRGIAIDYDDLCCEIGREIREDALNCLRLIMGRNDDRHSHVNFIMN